MLLYSFTSLELPLPLILAALTSTFKERCYLGHVLQHSPNCLASDSRDRVYAFIGLAEPGYNIIPSYQGANRLEHVLI
jgi:hypothetical protein